MATSDDVATALHEYADDARVPHLHKYFRAGPGGYGEGDEFIGARVPEIRSVAKRFADLPLAEVEVLLTDPIHEYRLAGLFILNGRFARAAEIGDVAEQRQLIDRYLAAVRAGRVNNWDLVDASAYHLLGRWLAERPRDPLFALAGSESLWQRRVAVIATLHFIRAGDPSTTLALAERLLDDPEDLIHKAVGWMLREVGNRVSEQTLLTFLETHAAAMPRTMLSYATERLDPDVRARLRDLRSDP